jgi:O-antigen/teichoic acid export membrane protein
LDQATVSGASFVTNVMIGRLCGDEELGLFSLLMTIVALVICAQYALVLTPFTVFVPKLQPTDQARYTGDTLLQAGTLAALCSGITVCLALSFSWGGQPGLAQLSWIASATLPLLLLRDLMRRIDLAHLRMGRALAIDGAVLTLQIVLLGGLAMAGQFTTARAMLAVGVASGLVGLGAALLSRQEIRFSRGSFRSTIAKNWKLGRWVFADSMTGALKYQSIPWIMMAVLGASATGAYAACQSVASLARPFLMGFSNFLIPKITNTYSTAGCQAMQRSVRLATLLLAAAMTAFCIGMVLGGDWGMRLVYGPDFGGLGWVVSVLAVGISITAVAQPASGGLLALERAELGFVVRGVGLGVSTLIALVLLEPLGIIGAAYGLLVGSSLGVLILYFFYQAAVRRCLQSQDPSAPPPIEARCA